MARRLRTTALALALLIGPSAGVSQSASFPSSRLLKEPDAWYRSEAGKTVIDRVLSNQSDLGAWPKNVDTSAKPFEGNRSKIQGTFDNGATTGEVRFLARAFRLTGEERCRAAVVKAIDQILTAQYPTGGWPQFYPPGTGYHRHITFNDDTMVRLLELLREVGRSDEFASLDKPRREAALRAFNAGIRCIVRCQVVVDGKPTVWCAQHDEKTLEPRKGRTFEPISLSGSESAGILMLLMSLEKPDPEVVKAIEAGVRWFEGAKLVGIRLDRSGGDLKVVKDPSARCSGLGLSRSGRVDRSFRDGTASSSMTLPRSTPSAGTATPGTGPGVGRSPIGMPDGGSLKARRPWSLVKVALSIGFDPCKVNHGIDRPS